MGRFTDPEGHGAACRLAPGRTEVTLGRMLAGLGIPRATARLPGQVEGNLPLYRKWGFAVVGEGRVLKQGLPMWVMLREPYQPIG